MPSVVKYTLRRIVSLLLTAAVLFSCLPAQAAGMSVQLVPGDPATVVPVGTTIAFEVRGSGTAAVSLMVVPPDSRQKIIPGGSHQVTFSQPGMYVIAGYGANGTDENAAGFQRCMSPFHIVQAVGDAAEQPEELSCTLTLEAFAKPAWVPMKNAELRWNELRMWVKLTDQQIPEGARLQVDLYYNHDKRTVLDCEVGTDTDWNILCTEDAKMLMAGGSGEPDYGRYALSAAATVFTADGQKITAAEPFVMGWYSPEMLYVNEFFNDRWVYGGSDMGKRLQKWLDMSERKEGDRSSSGYLMLEQEIKFRDGRKGQEAYIKWAQKALSVVSSLGVELIFDKYTDEQAKKKFGEAGKDALPYYNMLGEVYNAYAQELLTNMQQLARGAYIEEELAKNTKLVNFQKNADAVYKNADFVDKVRNPDDGISDSLLYVFTPINDSSSYYVMGNPNKAPEKVQNFKLTEVLEIDAADGGEPTLWMSWVGENGATYSGGADHFASIAYGGDRVVMDTSVVKGTKFATGSFEASMFRDMTKTSGEYNLVNQRDAITTYIGKDGKRKIKLDNTEVDFTAQKIQELGLSDYLSLEDQQALKYYSNQVEVKKTSAWEMGGKILDLAGIGLDVYQLYTNTTSYSELQRAYFNTYKQISNEHIHSLYNWYMALEDSNEPDKEALQAAVKALMEDIYHSCDESLKKAAVQQNVFIQTSGMWANTIFDVMEFICEIPQVSAALTKAAKSVGKQVVNATKGAVKWVVQTATKASAAAAAQTVVVTGAASGTTAATTTATTAAKGVGAAAKTASLALAAVSIGSLVYDLLFSAHIGYMDSIYNVFNTKTTLVDTIESTLRAYAGEPTHQRAVDVIESLYLMKELKLKGENLVISDYLRDMYKHYGLDGVKEQLILMNEIVNMDSNYTLKGSRAFDMVYVVYENYVAGRRDNLKDAGYGIEGVGGIGGGDDAILDSRVVGIYRSSGSSPCTFQGVELEEVPTAVFNAKKLRSSREDAYQYGVKEPDWIENSNAFASDWQTDMVASPGERHFVKTMWAYNNHGLSLLVTGDEFDRYCAGESEVNRILRENNDATGDEELFWWEEKEWQHQQRIVWTYVTRKYIESLPMFDRTTGK
nr:hypothetical protein [Clostridia bacterium]